MKMAILLSFVFAIPSLLSAQDGCLHPYADVEIPPVPTEILIAQSDQTVPIGNEPLTEEQRNDPIGAELPVRLSLSESAALLFPEAAQRRLHLECDGRDRSSELCQLFKDSTIMQGRITAALGRQLSHVSGLLPTYDEIVSGGRTLFVHYVNTVAIHQRTIEEVVELATDHRLAAFIRDHVQEIAEETLAGRIRRLQ